MSHPAEQRQLVDCPTCGGDGWMVDPDIPSVVICPNLACINGKVPEPIEVYNERQAAIADAAGGAAWWERPWEWRGKRDVD